jgi:hypothetical protein
MKRRPILRAAFRQADTRCGNDDALPARGYPPVRQRSPRPPSSGPSWPLRNAVLKRGGGRRAAVTASGRTFRRCSARICFCRSQSIAAAQGGIRGPLRASSEPRASVAESGHRADRRSATCARRRARWTGKRHDCTRRRRRVRSHAPQAVPRCRAPSAPCPARPAARR